MREINAKQITEVVKKLCIDANLYLGEDVLAAFDRGEKVEESPVGKEMFQQLKENARIAREEKMPMCQDRLRGARSGCAYRGGRFQRRR